MSSLHSVPHNQLQDCQLFTEKLSCELFYICAVHDIFSLALWGIGLQQSDQLHVNEVWTAGFEQEVGIKVERKLHYVLEAALSVHHDAYSPITDNAL